jgi:NADPH:quinone reductase
MIERGTLMNAIRIHRHGGPEVLDYENIPEPLPGKGETRVRLEASGVNFIDTYQRSGMYPRTVPFIPGLEGAGVVEAVGEGVGEVSIGDRVAFTGVPGAYAEAVVAPEWKFVRLPSGIATKTGAALMLQGLTAHYLVRTTFAIQPGHTVLVHAAAGGVGLLLVQMAKLLGATVVGTVSTSAKAELARAAGADEIILYTEEEFAPAVRKITGGRGVDAVYDGVGAATFDGSLDALAPLGTMALFGAASGPVPPVDTALLSGKGSLRLTRTSLPDHIPDRTAILERTGDLFQWIADGNLSVRIGLELPLEQAAEAHRRLEARLTTGKVLLIPE